MRARKSALAMAGALALGFAACSTEGTAPAPTTAPTAAPTTVESYSGDALVRISNAQYDSAVRDLLGVNEVSPSAFPMDFSSGDHFEQYFDAADTLGEQVFADPLLSSRLLTCEPNVDAACTRQIVASFGERAFRSPMTSDDVDRLTKVATDAVALGETPVDSIKQVVKTVLASPQFLYNVVPSQAL